MNTQTDIPASFVNRWRVGTWFDEGDANAQRECEVLGYVRDEETGMDVCHVRFIDMPDLFADREAYYTPHMLFPVLP